MKASALAVFFTTAIVARCDTFKGRGSAGTDFVVLFSWNNVKSTVDNSLDFTNSLFGFDATLTVTYNEPEGNGDVKHVKKVIALPFWTSHRLEFSHVMMYEGIHEGVDRYPNRIIRVHSTTPITVIANSISQQGEGDIFTVIPTAMAGTHYSFGMPQPKKNVGLSMVYFLPANEDSTVRLRIVGENVKEMEVKISANDSSSVSVFGGPSERFAVQANGSAEFLIIAAAHGVTADADSLTDYVAFMPVPILDSDDAIKACNNDHHITEVDHISAWMVGFPPNTISGRLTIDGWNNTYSEKDINPLMPPKLFGALDTVQGNSLDVHSSSFMYLSGYEGYNEVSRQKTGACADMIPSWSQFITGTSIFTAPHNAVISIIADVEAAHSLKIDYDEMELSDFERVPFFEKNAYIYSTELDYLGSSHHSISSKGHYIYRIHAQAANGHIQCYVPAFGSQGDWLSNGTGREPPPKALDFPGSAGTKFLFVIPPNNDFDRSQTTVHLDITNPLVATAANVTITYNLLTEIGGGISVEPAEKRVVIMPMSSVKVPMKSEVIYTWFSMPMQTIDHALIRITSDHPITVIVNNFAENGAGDIFAVWPFSMQGEHYAFSTPGRGNAIVYLIAQKRDVEINATIISADSEESTLKTVMAGHNSLYWRLTGARSLYTDGNSSYSVIVAVRKVPTKSSSTGKHSTDFMCFSPAPLENSVCSEHIHRISTTSSASSFLFTPVRNSNGTTVNVHGLSEKQTQLIAHPGQNPIVLSVRDFGSSLDLYTDCDNSSIEIVRLGDYNETELRDGVFMDLVPRWDQITTGATIFTTHAIGDEIVIITDLESVQNNFFFDYSYAWSYPSFTRAPYYGANIYLKKIISKHSGVHVLFSLGWYIVQIHGSDKNGHAYSYTPALYAHSVPVQPTSPAFTPVLHTTSVSQRSSSTTTVPSTMRSITMTTATTLSHRTTTTSGAHSGFVVNTIRCLLVIVALLTSSPWLSTVLISQLLSVVVIV